MLTADRGNIRMLSSAPSPVSTFEKVLRAFGTGGFTYADLVVQLERLLAIGASPTAMLEALRRRERIEPFPEYAHVEVVRLLNAAIAKRAAEGAETEAEYEPDAVPDQLPESVLSPARPTSAELVDDAFDDSLADSVTLTEAARSRSEEALRESKRYQAELSVVRDTLAARDATIAQVLNSLAERDAQLAALQQQHAKLVPMLEARGTQLEADLRAAQTRANALVAELAAARAALQSEQNKSRGFDKAWAEGLASNEAARSHGEEALLEAKRYQGESLALRDALAAREATLAQIKHSLGERDAQLAALQQEHAKIVPMLEARAKAGAQPEAKLPTLRTPADASDLQELLRSREWRRGFDQNLYGELDARAQAAEAERARLQTERDDLKGQVMRLRSQLGANKVQVDKMRMAASPAAFPQPAPDAGSRGQRVSGTPVRKQGPRWSSIARPVIVSVAVAVLAVAVVAVTAWYLVQRAPAAKEASVLASASAPVPDPGTVIRDCPTCPTMVVLPRGRFKQGSMRAESGSASFESPMHWVAIGPSVSMSSNAVTVEEFQQFVTDTGRDIRGCDIYDGDWKHRPDNSWKNPGFPQTATHPVTCVSWNDAKAYVGWLSTKTGHPYRLPSASEWEYAARGGGEAIQPWSASGAACATANVADASAAQRYPGWTVFACNDGYVYTAPVGSFKANSFGLNDMLGNVFQWTEDCWHADYSGAPIDGSARTDGDCSERELRGGSWFSTPAYVRANYRNHFAADYRTSSVGIRLVRDIGP
jgi:formylglycine-generating enzyme required for sulfatase activity